jgi:phosphoglycerol transferase MdoB-like AlkP superfamily enzyme
MNLADTVYYPITLKRTTAALFQQFSNEVNLLNLTLRFFVEYWYMVLLAVLFISLLTYLYRHVNLVPAPADNIWIYTIGQFIVMTLSVYLVVVGIRGGFKHSTRPITLSNASAYIEKPNQRAIVLNTPFAIFRTLKKNALQEKSYFITQEEQEKIYTAHHRATHSDSLIKKNVVILILESFGTEHIGALNKDIGGYAGFTPFLDSLIEYSYTFKHSYANGRKSISGMPSVLASIPSLVNPFILSHYSGNKINSLASVLAKEGYFTSFYHGAANGSMGFDAFANQAGFENYVGKNEFNNDEFYDGIWGIWDEEFLQFFNKELTATPQPFLAALFSVSSHHPFILPKKNKKSFPFGTLNIHKNIGYTDYSLRKFFDEARSAEWYSNTVFVITADHASAESDFSKYKTSLGSFNVPIIIFDPQNQSLVGIDENTVVQQNDIMPTVLSLLNYQKDYIAFGTDMFQESTDHFAINYVGDAYQLVMDGYMLQHDGGRTLAVYDIEKDILLTQNLIGKQSIIQTKLETKLKAIIQEYNRRLIRDEMTVN